MKRRITVCALFVLFFANFVFAQTEEHLTFKGIPINGSLTTFVQKMKTAGFSFVEYVSDNTIAVFSGKFAGDDAKIYVASSPKTKTVFKVVVYYGKQTSWQSIKSDYFKYVAAMTEKYGEPSSHYEFFTRPYYEGDGYELQALRHEKCNYISFYDTQNGAIVVEMSTSEKISIGYEDAINVEIFKREKKSVIQSDL